VTITGDTSNAEAWMGDLSQESIPLDSIDEAVSNITSGDHPAIKPAPSLSVEIPRGYSDDGVSQTTVRLRELTGRDEEYLSRYKTSDTLFDGILSLGVVSIGSVDLASLPVSERSKVLGKLLIGERLMIYLAVVQSTFGNERDMSFTCPHCASEQTTLVLLDTDFPISVPDDLQFLNTYTTSSGVEIVYRLVTGADVLASATDKPASASVQNTNLLTRLIRSVDGKTPMYMDEFVRDMSLNDRGKLLSDVMDRQPAVSLSLTLECSSCHEEVLIPVQWEELFRPR
jgi:hypothetical protein